MFVAMTGSACGKAVFTVSDAVDMARRSIPVILVSAIGSLVYTAIIIVPLIVVHRFATSPVLKMSLGSKRLMEY